MYLSQLRHLILLIHLVNHIMYVITDYINIVYTRRMLHWIGFTS